MSDVGGRPIRVVHVLGAIRPSGMERMVQSALPHWSQQNIETCIISLGERTSYSDELRASGAAVSHMRPVRTLGAFVELRRLFRNLRPDVVHVHTESAFALVTYAARLSNRSIPIVRTVHNIFPHAGRAARSRRIQAKIADKFVSIFVAPSRDVALSEQRLGRNPIVVPNWVDQKYSEYSSWPQGLDDPLVVIVGNASVIKNQHVAVVAATHNCMQIAYHGSENDAPSETILSLETASEKGLLRYRGTDEPFESLKNATVFLMPSLREGMSVALLEALAMGVPCVISDVPGQQWARDFSNVVLLPADDQAAWNHQLETLAAVQRAGQQRHNFPFSLHPERGASDYARIYRRAILGASNATSRCNSNRSTDGMRR